MFRKQSLHPYSPNFAVVFSVVLCCVLLGLVGVEGGLEPTLENSVKQDQDNIQDEILHVSNYYNNLPYSIIFIYIIHKLGQNYNIRIPKY